ncbi:MAG: LysR family transcriptional regulator [Pseudomonadota bacterium]|nr:LysR family transcriptional regulator [Pseudomonadota bacterium]
MRFKGMDLNLFVAFEALMETRSTARAGEKIGLSQPATSAALARLRDFFGDELLVVRGRRMYPTPLAETLLPRVRECLRSAEGALATSSSFDPARARRTFRVVTSDYVMAAVLAPLLRELAHEAPGIALQLLLPSQAAAESLRRGEADIVIAPSEYAIPGVPSQLLYEEHYVLVGAPDHPIFAGAFTLEEMLHYGFVAVSVGNERSATVGDHQLDTIGHTRRIEVTAPSFTAVPWLLAGTRRLTLMHSRFARLVRAQFGLACAPLPVDLPPLRQIVHFHETRAHDDGVAWLIARIREQAGPNVIDAAS